MTETIKKIDDNIIEVTRSVEQKIRYRKDALLSQKERVEALLLNFEK